MKKLLILLVFVSACASASPPQPDQPAIESAVLAVYNVISGPAGHRDWDRFDSLVRQVRRAELPLTEHTGKAPQPEAFARRAPSVHPNAVKAPVKVHQQPGR